METINCIVCGESKSTPYIEVSDRLSQNLELFQLVKCDCNFVYLNPRPSEANISTYYKSPDYDPHNFLKNNNEDGKSLINLASNLNGDEFQSFMMGESNLLTKLKIIKSMPKLAFIRELFN